MSARAAALAAFAALAAVGCTLIVDHELSGYTTPPDAGPTVCDGGSCDAGASCSDLVYLDGTPDAGGELFHSGVTAPAFRGAAWPPPLKTSTNFGSTLTFLRDGGLELVNGYEPNPAAPGDLPPVFLRSETSFTPTNAYPAPGHEGPGSFSFGCAEIIAATYDSLRDQTTWRLIPGGCAEDSTFYDGGLTTGGPDLQAPALGWGGYPDGGGVVAALFGTRAQACDEVFPLSCFPPHAGTVPATGARLIDSLVAADGMNVWVVTTAGSSTQLWSADFSTKVGSPVVAWGGRTAALAPDIGIAMRIVSGSIEAHIFDSAGTLRGNPGNFALGDASAYGLEINRIGTSATLRVAWVGGDGQARVATLDASAPAALSLSTPAVVCGSRGATFVAPTSSVTAAVLVGDALYLRRTP